MCCQMSKNYCVFRDERMECDKFLIYLQVNMSTINITILAKDVMYVVTTMITITKGWRGLHQCRFL